MHSIDWSIVAIVLAGVTYAAIKTNKYNKSVADFLSANRCAGRYLLAIAEGEAAMGAISVLALFEMWPKTGFTYQYWMQAVIPLSLLMTLTGFVHYRYRQTRAMTMAQFFEMRYSRKFRIFAGIVTWVSGVVNFGLFPVVGARFFENFCGFKSNIVLLGPLSLDLTLLLIMLVLLGLALLFTFIGGQIAVLVTDFWQGLFAMAMFILIIAFLWYKFSWSQMGESLVMVSEPGKSLIDPLDVGAKKDFGFSFFAVMMFFAVYNRMAWQGNQGYNSAAITPHEAKMSKVVGTLKYTAVLLGLTMMPIAAITYLNHPDYSDKAAAITAQISSSFPGDNILQGQMRVPITLSHILPIGLMGAFTAAMLGFFISTNNTQIHSWGSIFVQDVMCPLRKKPLTQKQHMLYLRLSIVGVTVFALFFGLLFPLKEYIWMFLAITGAIYLGGAGSVIIGGLYWKRGTTAAAWTAMITGAVIAVGSIALRILWEHIPWLVERWGTTFPINSQMMSFCASLCAVIVYVVISLLSKDPKVNMDRLLHRGKYAVKEEEEELKKKATKEKKIGRLWKVIGVNSHEFSKVDKGLFVFLFCLSSFWVLGFGITVTLGIIGWMNQERWLHWWLFIMMVWFGVGLAGVIWVMIGGLIDLKKMYARLATQERNELDDGRVNEQFKYDDESDLENK